MSRVSVETWTTSRVAPPEAVNRWTHGLGCAASVPAAAILLFAALRETDGWVLAACGVYCAALVGLYAASALSHGFENRPRLRTGFRIADQVCIYLMIAGSFTPFAAAHLRTPYGLAQLAAMWLLAGVGIAVRIRRKGSVIGVTDLALCLLTGWIPVLSLGRFLSVGGPDGFALVIAGAVFYSGGTVFLMNDHRNPYLHGIWHLATLAGTCCHYLFLLNFVATA
ncbi:MAG: hemolysin III family protein [Planctomycetaceae bacterium]